MVSDSPLLRRVLVWQPWRGLVPSDARIASGGSDGQCYRDPLPGAKDE
jgi:hypothetical protein